MNIRDFFRELDAIENEAEDEYKRDIFENLVKSPIAREVMRKCLDPEFDMGFPPGTIFFTLVPEYESASTELRNVSALMDICHERYHSPHKASEIVGEYIGSFIEDPLYLIVAQEWLPRLFTKDLNVGIEWIGIKDLLESENEQNIKETFR